MSDKEGNYFFLNSCFLKLLLECKGDQPEATFVGFCFGLGFVCLSGL